MRKGAILIFLALISSCAHLRKQANHQQTATEKSPATIATTKIYIPLFQITDEDDKLRMKLILLSVFKITTMDGTGTSVCVKDNLVLTAARVIPLDNNLNPRTADAEVTSFKLEDGGVSIEEVRRVKVSLLKFNLQDDLALYEIRDPSVRCRPVVMSNKAPNFDDQYNRFGFNNGWKWAYGTYAGQHKPPNTNQEYDFYSMPVAPGMSGGPVLSNLGELVGLAVIMTGYTHRDVDNLGGFKIEREQYLGAVPYEQLKKFLKDI